MAKKAVSRSPHDRLLVRVLAELGAGRLRERIIDDPDCYVDGLCEGRTITIDPSVETVDVLLHELLHRLYPEWSEMYVRNRTTYLRTRLSTDQIAAIYDEFHRRVKRCKTPLKTDD